MKAKTKAEANAQLKILARIGAVSMLAEIRAQFPDLIPVTPKRPGKKPEAPVLRAKHKRKPMSASARRKLGRIMKKRMREYWTKRRAVEARG